MIAEVIRAHLIYLKGGDVSAALWSDIYDNTIHTKGSCVVTDTDGDKFFGDWTGKGPVGGEFAGEVTISGGTGKYAGMQGNWDFHCLGVGTDDQLYCRQKYTYKLP